MTDRHPTAVAAWQARMGLTDRRAAEMLGMATSTYQSYKRGRLRGRDIKPSTCLHWACAAIEAGLKPITEQKPNSAQQFENTC